MGTEFQLWVEGGGVAQQSMYLTQLTYICRNDSDGKTCIMSFTTLKSFKGMQKMSVRREGS